MVVALDNVRIRRFAAAREAADALGAQVSRKAAIAELERALEKPTDEERVLMTYYWRALDAGRSDRLASLFGFREEDILKYLPPSSFDRSGQSWQDLELRYGTGCSQWFKQKKAGLSDEKIRSAVRAFDHVPEEFQLLGELCIKAAWSPRPGSPDPPSTVTPRS